MFMRAIWRKGVIDEILRYLCERKKNLMLSAIMQILMYSVVIFGCALLLRSNTDKTIVQYIEQEKIFTKERVW